MLVEHARNLEGIDDAVHAEYGMEGTAVVGLLSCSLTDTSIDIDLVPGTRLGDLYGADHVTEKTHCNYGLAPDYRWLAESSGLRVAALEGDEVRAVERADHPLFVGTLYQPQRTSTPERPHPIWTELVRAVLESE